MSKKSLDIYDVSIEKHGITKPFSRGELTTLLKYIGVEVNTALAISTNVKGTLIKKKFVDKKTGEYSISSKELCNIVKKKLIDYEESGLLSPEDQFPEKYIFWRNVRNKREPMLILVGGGTAIGTTSIGRSLVSKLNFIVHSGTNPFKYELKGMFNLVMTDHIRDTMRGFAGVYPPKTKLDELFVSTYEAGKLNGSGNDKDVIDGFIRQTEIIKAGLNNIIENDILYRGSSIIVEGIHLIPSYLSSILPVFGDMDVRDYSFQFHIDILDEETHKLRLRDRQSESTLRGKKDYLGKYHEISVIKKYLFQQAKLKGIHVINTSELNEMEHKYVSTKIMDYIFEKLKHSERYDIRKSDVAIDR